MKTTAGWCSAMAASRAVGIEREIRAQRHADKATAVEAGRQLVHRKARPRRHHRRSRPGTGLDHQMDQFVRTVAEHQASAHRQAHGLAEPLLETARIRHRVAIQRLPAEALAQFALQRFRQREGILHRVELDEARPRSALDRPRSRECRRAAPRDSAACQMRPLITGSRRPPGAVPPTLRAQSVARRAPAWPPPDRAAVRRRQTH